MEISIPEDKRTQWKKLMFYFVIFFDNLLMPRLYIILGPINLLHSLKSGKETIN